jgi:two-component system cell cycle sensor histidine kinase/response regulator CckA
MTSKSTNKEKEQKVKDLEKKALKHIKPDKTPQESGLYQNLYENALVGLYRSRISDGKIIIANQIAANILGYDSIEELNREFEFGKSCLPEKGTDLLKSLEEYRTIVDFEIQVTRKDGEKRDLIIMAKIYPEDGYIEGVMIDVTDKKRLETQLQQAQKMEAISTLAGGIAHDFNNLLMGIQGYISLMLNDLDPGHPYYYRLKRIEDQIKIGAELTSQLLGFARGGKYVVKPIDINELVKNSVHMFVHTKKEITIRETYEQDLWTVEADQRQIEQVLLNLYINAWQAMPGGGDLYLSTSNIILDKKYAKHYKVKPGRYVKVSITDTGIGINETIRRRIFDPFFTTKKMGRGTGLGLASAYGIIKNHGGTINVYSEKGHGSTFNIYLPAIEALINSQESLSSAEEIKERNETILLVDDDQVILEVGKEMLTTLNYKVLLASGGNEAINFYNSNKDKIDLVILDMIMPGMGGRETYETLKRINPEIKVLLCSGYNINGEATEVMRQGANDFIRKPYTMKELSHTIRKILDK